MHSSSLPEQIADHPLQGAERLVVLRNPVSSHADKVNHRIDELYKDRRGILKQLGILDIEKVDTSAVHAENVYLLRQLGPSDAPAVAGGDGTVSDICAALLEVPVPKPLTVFAGGEANDLAHMLYGQTLVNKPARIIEKAQRATIHPLNILINPLYGGTEQHLTAFGYFGLGLTARLAQAFNEPDFRMRVAPKPSLVRLGHEASVIFKHLKTNHTFKVDGQQKGDYSEVLFLNGQRMAKTLRSRQQLTEAGAVFEEVAGDNYFSILAAISRLAVGASSRLAIGEGHKPGDRQGYIIKQHGGVLAQIDGESIRIPEDCYVQVSVSKRSVAVITARH